jgi:hypothetical protein
MTAARLLRLNGARYECVPAPGGEGLRGEVFELRRKADDAPVARARLVRSASRARLVVDSADRAAALALEDLSALLARHYGRRGRLDADLECDGRAAREPVAPCVDIPADYAARTGLARVREPRVLEFAGLDMFERRQWLGAPAARARGGLGKKAPRL